MNNQQRVLEFVNRYLADNGTMPTGETIARDLNLPSVANAWVYISRLRGEGLLPIAKRAKRAREHKPKPSQIKQDAILLFIKNYIVLHGYAPSNQDITNGLSLSSKSVTLFYLRRLEQAGLILRESKVARSIRVIEK